MQMSEVLADRDLKTRQRVFAAHAHDTQLLQHMVAVLTARAARPHGRERSIANAGLMEEGQLYAVCMQELAAQMAVHSPALSEMSGQLFHGFIGLFQRSVAHQEQRLAREREAHEKTRVQLKEAQGESEHWKELKDDIEKKLTNARRLIDDKDRSISTMEKRVHEALSEARRASSQLEEHLGVSTGKMGSKGSRAYAALHSGSKKKKGGGGGGEHGIPEGDILMGGALAALGADGQPLEQGGGGGGEEDDDGEAAAKRYEEEKRLKNAMMVDAATDGVRKRVADLEAFLKTALTDAELTGRAAEYLRRLVRTVGAVDFGRTGDVRSVDTQTGEDLLQPSEDQKKRRKSKRGSKDEGKEEGPGESPIERMLRLSRAGKLKLEGENARLLPPRIASRTVMQLMLDKATRGATESLPDFLYNFYLHMYGVKKLAEQNLIALILSCIEHQDAFKRLKTFVEVCGMLKEPSDNDASAEMACNMYYELNMVINQYNSELSGTPAWLTENKLPNGEDGNVAVCLASACRRTVRSLFAHIHSLHVETFDEIVNAMEDMTTDRKGKQVVDIDDLISDLLAKWVAGRQALREQVAALFSAGDVNNDGVLSFDEFTALVKVVLPAASEERIWRAFRECIDMSPSEYEHAMLSESVQPMSALPGIDHIMVGGISSEVFVNVIEVHGLLGANLSADSLTAAHRQLQAWKAPCAPGGGPTEELVALSPIGGGSGIPKDRRRRRSSAGFSEEPTLTRHDSHAQLRLDLLAHEWSESNQRMQTQINGLREALQAMPKGKDSSEGDALASELEGVPSQLDRLSTLIVPPDGKEPSQEDAAHGWEQYRSLSLKLSRLANKIEELATATAAKQAGKTSFKKKA